MTGTPGTAGAKTTIVVGSGVATLYYYCSVHSGMGGQANTNSTAGASNFDGSIQATTKASTTYGFSIVSYTGNGSAGATIGHGLNAAPQMIFIKTRNTARNWTVGHQGIASDPWTDYLTLNSSAAAGDLNTVWNDTAPTSSVFTVGSANGVNANTETHIAYCWSEVPGFSRFGSWTGNGSTTGPVITTGFKVRFLLIKRTDSTANWRIIDTERGANELYPNLNNAEGAFDPVTYTNDGFQIKVTDPNYNASGGTYIYAAFAGKPPGEIIDSLIDTPTNYEASSGNNGGNYATLNPLAKHDYSAATLSNGNLDVSFPGGGGFMTTSTIAVSSGKWYYEETITSTLSNTSATLVRGLENFTTSNTAFSWRGNGGTQGLTGSPTLSTYTDGDVLGIAVDVDNTQVTFYTVSYTHLRAHET